MNKKIIKVLFPIPSITIFILIFVAFKFGEVNGEPIVLGDAVEMSLVFYAVFLLPLNISIWILKKIYLYFKKKNPEPPKDSVNSSQITTKKANANKGPAITASEALKRNSEIELEKTKKAYNELVRKLDNTQALRDLEQEVSNFFSELGIHVLVGKSDIRAHQIIVRISPHEGVRVKTIMRFKDDLSIRLGVPIEMESFFKLGFIGIIIPIEYLKNKL